MGSRSVQLVVGCFVLAAMLALLALAFRVSGLAFFTQDHYYPLIAEFDNVGDLKVRAPVSIAGVTVGRVQSISLNPDDFRATVTLWVDRRFQELGQDTSADILTQGLLGSNYISLTPGYDTTVLKPGAQIQTTHSAIVLENLIGQLMYSLKSDDSAAASSSKKEQS